MLPYKPSTASTTPQPPPTPTVQAPNSPAGLTLAPAAGSALTVTWTAPATDSTHNAATGFNLQFSPSGAGTWTAVTNVSSPYLLSGLTPGENVDVEVQSVNAAGASAWSATATLATSAAAPNLPGAVTLAQGAGSDLTVTWNAPTADSTHNAASSFNLRSSPSGAGTWTIVSGVSSPFDLSGLAAGESVDVEVQSVNAAGASAWSAVATLTTTSASQGAPNAPAITGVAPPPDGTTGNLAITWTAPAPDSTHSAATGYNLRFSPTGAGTWTTVQGVTSPYRLTGLTGGAAFDIEVQAVGAAAATGAWSAVVTGTTWGATVAPSFMTAAPTQVHGAAVAPSSGVNMTATAAPTAVTGAAFAWSASASVLPTTGLIAATGDGQANGWGQFFNAPTNPGTYYLWLLAQGAGNVTTGALVTSAIVVS
jgi:hypothetical protein